MSKFSTLARQTITDSDKTKYIYYAAGDSQNPSLVIIPGFFGSYEDCLDMVDTFKDDYFVIIPAIAGWDEYLSLSFDATIPEYVRFIKGLIDVLKIKRVTFLGHSIGAIQSIDFASKYPFVVDRLVLISPFYVNDSFMYPFFKSMNTLARNLPIPLRRVAFLWRSRIFGIPADFFTVKVKNFPQKLGRIINHIRIQPLQNEEAVQKLWMSLIDFDFGKISDLVEPIHIIHGAEDALIWPKQAKRFHKLLGKGTLDIIPKAGHVPPVETPDELVALLKKYLEI